MSRATSARRLACEVGAACRERSAYAGDVLDAKLQEASISSKDAAYARLLALGVASTRGTLDEVLNRCMNSPRDVRPYVRDALRVSTYEIIFLRKDAYAVVDQGVGLVRSVEPKAARLANAVLRKVAKAAQSFPFGDPALDDEALARLYGFPLWLTRLLVTQMGREEAARFMAASNHPPTLYFAVNELRTSVAQELEVFKRARIKVDEVAVAALGSGVVQYKQGASILSCLKSLDTRAVASPDIRSEFAKGNLLVSDASAQYVAQLALPQERPRDFLEIGAGRGTKSVLLQSAAHHRWGKQLGLVPIDDHGFKIDLLRKRLTEYGCQSERAIVADARNLTPALGARMFDAGIVDAPCSGLGTLRRHPEIRWRLKQREIDDMTKLQLALLTEAASHIRKGGMLTYATCSPLLSENEVVIKRFLETEGGKQYRILPYHAPKAGKPILFFKSKLDAEGCDAHFAARLIRMT